MLALVLLGLSPAPDQVSALPFPTDPCYPNTPYAAFPPYAPSGWRDTDCQLEQEEIENHTPLSPLSPRDIYGVSMFSAPPESSSYTTIAGTSSLLSTESYTQSRLRNNYDDLTSLRCGQVESPTKNVVATQGQSAITQEASLRELKVQRKRENDRTKKKAKRSSDKQYYERICDVLSISLAPETTLAYRSEYLCIHPCWRS
jgi:hypothetical protein